MDGYDASAYGDRFADVYDSWYGDVTDVVACTQHLAALAAARGGGPVLELGVGTGRLAIPLAGLGVEVHGVDASAAMVERLRAKPGGDAIAVSIGDMADLHLPGAPPFSVAFVAFNTFFNLPTEAAQRRCLERVGRHLAPDGVLVIEAVVPSDDVGTSAEAAVSARHPTPGEVIMTVSRVDAASQTITGQHVHMSGGGVRQRPWHLRYVTPAQLDALAADAGLALQARAAGWDGEPFTASSGVHVSTYRRANVRDVPEDPPAEPS